MEKYEFFVSHATEADGRIKVFLDSLGKQLKAFFAGKGYALSFWNDEKKLRASEEFTPAIQKAVNEETQGGILFLDEDSANSHFITKHELPAMQARFQNEENYFFFIVLFGDYLFAHDERFKWLNVVQVRRRDFFPNRMETEGKSLISFEEVYDAMEKGNLTTRDVKKYAKIVAESVIQNLGDRLKEKKKENKPIKSFESLGALLNTGKIEVSEAEEEAEAKNNMLEGEARAALNTLFPRFFGREKELAWLSAFYEHPMQRIACLYGEPFVGKSALVKMSLAQKEIKKHTLEREVDDQASDTLKDRTAREQQHMRDNITSETRLYHLSRCELLLQGKPEKNKMLRFRREFYDFLREVLRKFPSLKIVFESRYDIVLTAKNTTTQNEERLQPEECKVERVSPLPFAEIIAHYCKKNGLLEKYSQEELKRLYEELDGNFFLFKEAFADDENKTITHKLQSVSDYYEALNRVVNKLIGYLTRNERIVLAALCSFAEKNKTSSEEEQLIKDITPVLQGKKKKTPDVSQLLKALHKKVQIEYDENPPPAYYLNPQLRQATLNWFFQSNEQYLRFGQHFPEPPKTLVSLAYSGKWGEFYSTVKKLRKAKEYAKVLSALEEAKLAPNRKPEGVFHQEAITYRDMGKVEKAIEIWEEMVEKNHVHSINELGRTYAAMKEYPKAVAVLEKAVAKGNIQSFNELGRTYAAMEKYDKAVAVLEKAVAKGHIPAMNELGRTYAAMEKYDKAVAVLEKGLALKPNDEQFMNELGRTYAAMEKYDKAVAVLEKAVAKGNIQSFNELGRTYAAMEKYDKAVAVLEKGLALKPNDEQFMNELGRTYAAMEKYDKAVAVLEKAVAKGHIPAMNELGRTYAAMENYAKAFAVVKRGLKIAPNNFYLRTTQQAIRKKALHHALEVLLPSVEYAALFELLRALDLMDAPLHQLQKEFVGGQAKHDADFNARLRTALQAK